MGLDVPAQDASCQCTFDSIHTSTLALALSVPVEHFNMVFHQPWQQKYTTTAAVPPTAGQLVTSERGVCGGPLAFHYANLMSHTAFRQSLVCVSLLHQVHQQLSAANKSSGSYSNSTQMRQRYQTAAMAAAAAKVKVGRCQ
jgi:hypothetical protein